MTKNEEKIGQLALEFVNKYEVLSQTFAGATKNLDGLRQELEDAKKLYDNSTKKWWIVYQLPITIGSIALITTVLFVILYHLSKEVCVLSFSPEPSFRYERCQPLSN